MMKGFYKKYLLPGIVFQSVVIAGGYGTGRELAEYFMPGGNLGGLLAMLIVVPLIWGGICAMAFEVSRVNAAYNYKSFSKAILGKGWRLFELAYFIFMILVLAVVISAGGEVLDALIGTGKIFGGLLTAFLIFVLVWAGETAISGFFSGWSVLMLGVFAAFAFLCLKRFGFDPGVSVIRSGWMGGGVKYALYNLGSLPAALFASRFAENRSQAIISGMICGILGILPAALLYLPMCGFYPGIASVQMPTDHILGMLGSPLLRFLFRVLLIGTLIETGTGMIFAVARRFEEEPKISKKHIRPASAMICLVISGIISTAGMGEIIATGYSAMSWVMLCAMVIPLVPAFVKAVRKTIENPAKKE